MTSIRIETQFSELGVTADHLNALHQKLNGDLTPLMQAIGAVLESSTTERFNVSKQAPDGGYWANLLPSTLKQKTNQNANDKGILVETGDLMRSITYYADKNSVTIGTPETYGVYHQFGTKHMLARPFLGISDQDEKDIFEMINDYLAS